MHRVDASGATAGNLFTNGDPVLAIPATRLEEDWHNAVQEEIVNVIEDAGIVLDKMDWTQLMQSISIIAKRDAYSLIGQPIAIEGTEIPDITRYIELTKDLTGVGQYNEGKLSGQAFVDVSQQRYYTAVVSDPDSPMFGQTIKLRNSVFDISSGSEVEAPCVVSASSTSGSFRANRFQGHEHGSYSHLDNAGTGGTATQPYPYQSQPSKVRTYSIVDDGVNGTPRTGSTTEQNNITARFFMRIK